MGGRARGARPLFSPTAVLSGKFGIGTYVQIDLQMFQSSFGNFRDSGSSDFVCMHARARTPYYVPYVPSGLRVTYCLQGMHTSLLCWTRVGLDSFI